MDFAQHFTYIFWYHSDVLLRHRTSSSGVLCLDIYLEVDETKKEYYKLKTKKEILRRMQQLIFQQRIIHIRNWYNNKKQPIMNNEQYILKLNGKSQ